MSTRRAGGKGRPSRNAKRKGWISSRFNSERYQPLDRAALGTMIVLSIIISVMLLLGSQALIRVRTFSWQGNAVGSNDIAFMLTFTQPVDPQSVEENLKIEPALLGKFSWAGRRMAYTLAVPAPYGESYTISLPEATALNGRGGFTPFKSEFHTRDRTFAYIGAEGDDQGRLILFNLTRQEKTQLTPENQVVVDFKPYPGRDRILYSATQKTDDPDTISFPQLYTVSTGIASPTPSPQWQFWRRRTDGNPNEQDRTAETGKTTLILDNKDYQNLRFDLSANGEVIVVQRVNQQNPADYGPWVVVEGAPPRKLETEPSGDFQIAPDSASLLLQQGEGTAVVSLEPDLDTQDKGGLLDFLPDYGLTLDVANDGSAAAFVNFNQDDPENQFTQSLFWVSSAGVERSLLQTDGSIVSAQFSENNEILYCLINLLIEVGEDNYQNAPYLAAVNIKTGEEQKLIEMPPQPEITVSPSPDGLAILFDEVLTGPQQAASSDFTGATHRLWLLPLFGTLAERLGGEPVSLPPTKLEIAGRQPVWLP